MSKSFTRTEHHLVFATYGRQNWLTPDLREELYRVMAHAIRSKGGIVYAVGGTANHCHLDLEIPVSVRACDVVAALKANSSGWLRRRGGRYAAFSWQKGYSLFSVSPSHGRALRRYIKNQEEHHRTVSFEEELDQLLAKYARPDRRDGDG